MAGRPTCPFPVKYCSGQWKCNRVLRGRLTSRRQSISRRAILGTRSKLRCNKTARVAVVPPYVRGDFGGEMSRSVVGGSSLSLLRV